MLKRKSPNRIRRARRLRDSATDSEKRLWTQLRSRGLAGRKFRRQHPIGPYVADFACLAAGVVVEIDGGQHTTRTAADARRTAFLESRGFRVLRFWNHEVLENIEGVLTAIAAAIQKPSPSRLRRVPPSPASGRGKK